MGRSALVPEEDPQRIGGYWLAGRLGAGGQAVVYEAYDATGSRFALKALRAGGSFGRPAQREVEAATRVAPFCTARVLAADLSAERPYIVSEFVDGPTLHAAVAEHGPLRDDALHRLAIGTITAIAAVHRAGVVHRDLKPANVLLGPDGPRVIDFGIARVMTESGTASQGFVGTLRYMAPEQFEGQADHATDIHAWGAVMVFAATGRHAFGGESDGEILHAVRHTMPDLPAVPPALRSLVAAALAKRADQRPTATELLLDLIGNVAAGGNIARTAESPTVHLPAGIAGQPETEPTQDAHQAITTPAGDALLRMGSGAAAWQLAPMPAGGPSRALGEVGEELFLGLTMEQRQVLPQLLLRMLEPEPDGGIALRSVDLHELSAAGTPELEMVVQRLVEAELVTRRGDRVALGSAALAQAWPRLRGWLADEGEGLRLLGRLRTATLSWYEHGHRDGDLLQGSLLEQATGWAATGRTRVELHRSERDFLDASRRLRGRQERRRRTLTAVLAGMVVVLLLAGGGLMVLTGIANAERQRADEQRNLALARQLVAQSELVAETDPVVSRLLAVAAAELAPPESPEVRHALQAAALRRDLAVLPGRTGAGTAGSGSARSLTFSPDGALLAVTSHSGEHLWWTVSSRQPYGGPSAQVAEAGHTVEFSPDGAALATSGDGQTRLWDLLSGDELGQPLGQEGGQLAFSPDGALLAVSGNDQTQLWDVADRAPIGDPLPVAGDLVFSPGGELLSSWTSEEVWVWDTATQQELNLDLQVRGFVRAVRFSADATQLTTLGVRSDLVTPDRERVLQTWELDTGRILFEHAFDDQEQQVLSLSDWAISPDGSILAEVGGSSLGATGAAPGTSWVMLWDTATGEPLTQPLLGHTDRVSAVAFSPDGRVLATGGDDDTVRLWDLSSAYPAVELSYPTSGPVQFSDDGIYMATGGPDGTVQLFRESDSEPHSWEPAGEPLHGDEPMEPAAFSPDGGTLATVARRPRPGEPHVVWLWDVATGQPAQEAIIGAIADHGFRFPVPASVSFQADGELVALGVTGDGAHGGLGFVDIPTAQRIADPIATEVVGAWIWISPDNETYATAHSGSMQVWSLATHEQISQLGPGLWRERSLPSVAFSPDGQLVAVGGAGSSMWLYEVATGERIGEPVFAPSAESTMRFSPDSQLLAVNSLGAPGSVSSVQLWHVATRQPVGDAMLGTSVSQVTFHPSGQLLVGWRRSGPERPAVPLRSWDLSMLGGDVAVHLCAQAGRSLTEREWERYLPDLPFREVC